MQIPLDITFRNVDKTEEIEALIREKTAKLEKFCDHITRCQVAVEQPHQRPSAGAPYRVRIDITVPPGHEIVATEEPTTNDLRNELPTVVRSAFDAARRQLQELVDRQRGQVKIHPQQEVQGFVTKLFRDEGYGFLRTINGREIYFHQNSVLNDEFDQLEVGHGVRFIEEEGEKGPQASTVQVIDKPGAPLPESASSEIEPPPGWSS